jgi:poly-gamma-glutamate capsule biosynthesis protein CapA/YwtB (metallophosphatase superfamily)
MVCSRYSLEFSKLTFALLLFLQGHLAWTQKQELSLLFIGDIMQHQSQIDHAFQKTSDTYEYNSGFQFVKPIIQSADYTVANLELTFGGSPYTGYPTFSAPEALGLALKEAGVNCLITANNHSCDKGRFGIYNTIDFLDNIQMDHTGTFINAQTRNFHYPMRIEKKGFTLSLLAYTYGTNGLKVPEPAVVNLIDKAQMELDIEAAKAQKTDKIIAYMHWGGEYQTKPNKDQLELAQWMIDKGVDIIIGSHPHVIQRMENYLEPRQKKDVVVVYSLGNYLSNQRNRGTDGGLMAKVVLVKEKNQVKIDHLGYYLTWNYTPTIENRKYWYILPVSEFERKPDFMDKTSFEAMKVFRDDSRKLMESDNINAFEYVYNPGLANWVIK